jgi:hypothetical protein
MKNGRTSVLIVGRKGYFSRGNQYGSGIPRYANALYDDLKKFIKVDYVEFEQPSILFPGFGISNDLVQSIKFFGVYKIHLKYKIIHNPDPGIKIFYKKKSVAHYISPPSMILFLFWIQML